MDIIAENVKISSKFVHTNNATVIKEKYQSNDVTAIIIQYDYEGFPENMVISTNLAGYNSFPPDNDHFFAPDYSEYEGIPQELEKAGVATIINSIKIGMGTGFLMKLA